VPVELNLQDVGTHTAVKANRLGKLSKVKERLPQCILGHMAKLLDVGLKFGRSARKIHM